MFDPGSQSARHWLQQLDRAKAAHADWTEATVGRLVCPMHGSVRSGTDTGPRQCAFGRWYYDSAPAELKRQPTYEAIGLEHHRVHAIAQRMLRFAETGMQVTPEDYRQFTSGNRRLVLELDVLRHSLQDALAHRDCLTGVLERDALQPALREWHELARRGVQPCCVVFMDLDHFKQVNDTHGHLTGDRVLALSAERIASALRPYDRVFRYGGDEFVMLLPAVGLDDARRVVDRVREKLSATALDTAPDGTRISATASFGLAALDPVLPVRDSLDRADVALMAAKSMGRNRVVAWDPGIQTARGLPALKLGPDVTNS